MGNNAVRFPPEKPEKEPELQPKESRRKKRTVVGTHIANSEIGCEIEKMNSRASVLHKD